MCCNIVALLSIYTQELQDAIIFSEKSIFAAIPLDRSPLSGLF